MPKIFYTKPFLNYAAQIALLKSRGMKFADETKALHLLKRISYYRFSVYWRPLLVNKQLLIFKPNADFETAFALYKFDRELRQLVLSELEKIEVAVRSQITHSLSMAYGSFWIEDETLFADSEKHKAILAKIRNELSRSDEEFIVSFKSTYSNPLPPSFITLEITSFGTLSQLYENLKAGIVKREIAQAFGLADKVFVSWLHGFVYIRNVCAHHARLWNKPLQIQPLFPRHTQYTWLMDKTVCNNRIYYVLSMIVYFLNTVNSNHTFKQKLDNLFLKYPNVDEKAMGFPANRRSELLWI
ncbi:MAG: Abi family protein [Tannerella sp.]|nr:Abi family protein [Tannerella sp.]